MEPSVKDLIKNAWRNFPLGITVITTRLEDGSAHGVVTERAISGSLTPPMVIFFLARRRGTYENLLRDRRFGMNILAADQLEWSEYFSIQPRPPQAPGTLRSTPTGIAMIEGCLAFMDCKLVAQYEMSETTQVVVGEVQDIEVRDGLPLIIMGGEYLGVVSGPEG